MMMNMCFGLSSDVINHIVVTASCCIHGRLSPAKMPVDCQELELEGALRISGAAEAQIVVDSLHVKNASWVWRPLGDGEQVCNLLHEL